MDTMFEGTPVQRTASIGLITTTLCSILATENLSTAIDLTELSLFGIDIPAVWTAANLVIYQKHADGVYKPVLGETGIELSITATAGAPIRFSNPAQFAALTDIKFLSGSVAIPVNQAGDRTLTVILRAI